MSDSDNQEPMRPIPDGGLKDAMPTWLKRPPAWRSLPTVDERIERTLPEPDTSVIDPTSLVDVSDLPQWLQTIAAREVEKLPEPDDAVQHAIKVVQAEEAEASELVDQSEDATPAVEPVVHQTLVESTSARGSTRVLWAIIAILVIAVLVLGALQFV
ncbi:MAG: hypothetical protein M9934_01895 [Thermomicrobiales bacterium]|nr:hypothetical protein [Thermomicrobiales bacterium]MCO5227021.1 hypothetical protein [Thermomicrobiales bacterium]